jgi:hypothetical protein
VLTQGGEAREHDWARESWVTLRDDVKGYLEILVAATISPFEFGRSWAQGRRRMNPLAAVVNAIALLGVWGQLWGRICGRPDELPWWSDLVRPSLAVVGNVVWALGCHALLRALGARRRVAVSVGAVLYGVAGPITVLSLLLNPLGVWAAAHKGLTPGVAGVFLVGFAASTLLTVLLSLLLAGAHQPLPRWRVAVAVVVITLIQLVLTVWAGWRWPAVLRWVT